MADHTAPETVQLYQDGQLSRATALSRLKKQVPGIGDSEAQRMLTEPSGMLPGPQPQDGGYGGPGGKKGGPPPLNANFRVRIRGNPLDELGLFFGAGDVVKLGMEGGQRGQEKRIQGIGRTQEGFFQIFFTDGTLMISRQEDGNDLFTRITRYDGRKNMLGKVDMPVVGEPGVFVSEHFVNSVKGQREYKSLFKDGRYVGYPGGSAQYAGPGTRPDGAGGTPPPAPPGSGGNQDGSIYDFNFNQGNPFPQITSPAAPAPTGPIGPAPAPGGGAPAPGGGPAGGGDTAGLDLSQSSPTPQPGWVFSDTTGQYHPRLPMGAGTASMMGASMTPAAGMGMSGGNPMSMGGMGAPGTAMDPMRPTRPAGMTAAIQAGQAMMPGMAQPMMGGMTRGGMPIVGSQAMSMAQRNAMAQQQPVMQEQQAPMGAGGGDMMQRSGGGGGGRYGSGANRRGARAGGPGGLNPANGGTGSDIVNIPGVMDVVRRYNSGQLGYRESYTALNRITGKAGSNRSLIGYARDHGGAVPNYDPSGRGGGNNVPSGANRYGGGGGGGGQMGGGRYSGGDMGAMNPGDMSGGQYGGSGPPALANYTTRLRGMDPNLLGVQPGDVVNVQPTGGAAMVENGAYQKLNGYGRGYVRPSLGPGVRRVQGFGYSPGGQAQIFFTDGTILQDRQDHQGGSNIRASMSPAADSGMGAPTGAAPGTPGAGGVTPTGFGRFGRLLDPTLEDIFGAGIARQAEFGNFLNQQQQPSGDTPGMSGAFRNFLERQSPLVATAFGLGDVLNPNPPNTFADFLGGMQGNLAQGFGGGTNDIFGGLNAATNMLKGGPLAANLSNTQRAAISNLSADPLSQFQMALQPTLWSMPTRFRDPMEDLAGQRFDSVLAANGTQPNFQFLPFIQSRGFSFF